MQLAKRAESATIPSIMEVTPTAEMKSAIEVDQANTLASDWREAVATMYRRSDWLMADFHRAEAERNITDDQLLRDIQGASRSGGGLYVPTLDTAHYVGQAHNQLPCLPRIVHEIEALGALVMGHTTSVVPRLWPQGSLEQRAGIVGQTEGPRGVRAVKQLIDKLNDNQKYWLLSVGIQIMFEHFQLFNASVAVVALEGLRKFCADQPASTKKPGIVEGFTALATQTDKAQLDRLAYRKVFESILGQAVAYDELATYSDVVAALDVYREAGAHRQSLERVWRYLYPGIIQLSKRSGTGVPGPVVDRKPDNASPGPPEKIADQKAELLATRYSVYQRLRADFGLSYGPRATNAPEVNIPARTLAKRTGKHFKEAAEMIMFLQKVQLMAKRAAHQGDRKTKILGCQDWLAEALDQEDEYGALVQYVRHCLVDSSRHLPAQAREAVAAFEPERTLAHMVELVRAQWPHIVAMHQHDLRGSIKVQPRELDMLHEIIGGLFDGLHTDNVAEVVQRRKGLKWRVQVQTAWLDLFHRAIRLQPAPTGVDEAPAPQEEPEDLAETEASAVARALQEALGRSKMADGDKFNLAADRIDLINAALDAYKDFGVYLAVRVDLLNISRKELPYFYIVLTYGDRKLILALHAAEDNSSLAYVCDKDTDDETWCRVFSGDRIILGRRDDVVRAIHARGQSILGHAVWFQHQLMMKLGVPRDIARRLPLTLYWNQKTGRGVLPRSPIASELPTD